MRETVINTEGDEIWREFVSCQKVVNAFKCDNASIFVGNRTICNFVTSCFPICNIEEGGHLVLDFGRELSGGVRLISGMMSPSLVRLRFGESIAEANGEPNMDHAIHDVKLPLSLLSAVDFGNTGFRFVRLDVLSGEVVLVNVIAVSIRRKLAQIGSFHSSDQRLNEIFDTSVQTVSLCVQEYILDGIKRDRLIWGGDLHPIFNTILPVFGDIDALDDTLEQLCFHTKGESFVNGHVSYPLWVIISIYDWFMHSGADWILRKYKHFISKSIEKYLAMIREDGSVVTDGYVFLDWLSSDDKAGIHAGFYGLLALGFSAAQKIYEYLDMDTASLFDAERRLRLKVPSPGRNKSAAALQHLAGLADRRDILQQDMFRSISTFMGGYIIQCLENKKALEVVKRYWGGMLDMGATTFWEDFDLDWLNDNPTRLDEMPVKGRPNIHLDYGRFCYKGLRHSLCHGWSSGPINWCYRKILGISPLRHGFSEISFTPDLCGLKEVEGVMATPRGTITVKLTEGRKPEIVVPGDVHIINKQRF